MRHRCGVCRAMWKNLRWGIVSGLIFAALFSIWVAVLALLRGSTRFEEYGVSLWRILESYFAGGICAGAVVGLARPLTKYRIGAAFVGILAAGPVALAIAIASDGMPRQWADGTWVAVWVIVLFLGPIVGYARWRQTYGRSG